MTDQHRSAGWPAPTNRERPDSNDDQRFDPPLGRPQASGHYAEQRTADDPPWMSGEQVPAEGEVPWDRPADMPWPEPDPDFGRWYDDPYALEADTQADTIATDETAEADQADPPTANLPAFQLPTQTQMAEAQPMATERPAATVIATADQSQPAPTPRMPVTPPYAVPTPPPYAATATPTFQMPMPQANAAPATGNGHAWETPDERDDPYDQFAPLADDLTVAEPMPSAATPNWGQQPGEPSESFSGPMIEAQPAPAPPIARRDSGSVFGDFFAQPALAPAPAAPAPAPAAPATPAAPAPPPTPAQLTPAVEPPIFARAPVEPAPAESSPLEAGGSAAMNDVDEWQPPTTEAPSRPWQSVGQASGPWSVQPVRPLPQRPAPAVKPTPTQPTTPQSTTVQPAAAPRSAEPMEPGRAARPPITFGANAPQAAPPTGPPTVRMAPTPPLPPRIAPSPTPQAPSTAQATTTAQPAQSAAVQPLPAWRMRAPQVQQSPAVSLHDSQFGQAASARVVTPQPRNAEMPASGTPAQRVQAAPVAPDHLVASAPAAPVQPMTASNAVPAQPVTSAQPVPAARPQAPTPADPTRASLAANATADELWFLAPQPQADASTSDADDEEENPSTISTLLWTVLVGLLVVALVLAFLQFLTGVFR